MAQRQALEIRVGAFIVSGFALFVAFIFFIGDLMVLFEPSYELHVLFDAANGITTGSPVQYAGVAVGRVEDVDIVRVSDQASPKVQLRIQLPASVLVRSDDEAVISTLGLLGEKFLEIAPGPGAGPLLKPGETLSGRPPVSTEDIFERSSDVLAELKQTLQGINSMVGDEESRIYLKEALREVRDATRSWRTIGDRLNLTMLYIEAGQGNIGKFLYDDELYKSSIDFIEDLKAHPWKLLHRPKESKDKE